MDHPLLKRARGMQGLRAACAAGAAFLVAACTPFDDPVLEIDPALVRDSSLVDLPSSEGFSVTRRYLLESFGAYGCASCPDAEGRLAPYLDSASPAHNPNLVIVNYHVNFTSSLTDPWITAGTQARHDAFGFTSLPQVKLNGANAPYGIREKDVRFAQGEYDSLIRRLRFEDTLTTLDFRLDTAGSVYDSAARRWEVRFTVLNRSLTARAGLTLRVLAVKNKAVVIPTLPNHPWEVIVAETTERDSSGALMSLAAMPPLTAKSYVVHLPIPPESERQPAPSVIESPANYALVIFAKNATGIIQNVFSWHFSPE
jgi:hypothetical protein